MQLCYGAYHTILECIISFRKYAFRWFILYNNGKKLCLIMDKYYLLIRKTLRVARYQSVAGCPESPASPCVSVTDSAIKETHEQSRSTATSW
jgi:hypothetical protein